MTVVQLAVGPGALSLADADTVAGVAREAGVVLRLVAGHLDPTVVAGYLAGRHPGLELLVDIPTTHNAPYNTARRVLSLDRATGGRVGVVLRTGDGDDVSDAVAPDRTATDRAERWAEYASILTRLWESFPREALVGDQENAVVADDTLIRPISHTGRFYRVAGPLDGPSSVRGRPEIAAADPEVRDSPWADLVLDVLDVLDDEAAPGDLDEILARVRAAIA
jgi:alkanesulfonate monooxygenase SsuD/methylene tetrahydromethanopterin reductase-like flavin-dependent oxidoreductase (luciferase family)